MSRFEVQTIGRQRFIADKTQKLLFYTTSITSTWHEANSSAVLSKVGERSGWRLPTLEELMSLINREKFHPASDMPELRARRVWTKTPYAGNANAIWTVNFYDGSILTAGLSDQCYIMFTRPLDEGRGMKTLTDLESNTIAIEISPDGGIVYDSISRSDSTPRYLEDQEIGSY